MIDYNLLLKYYIYLYIKIIKLKEHENNPRFRTNHQQRW